eukprot:m51a1_g5550 hypothetical protein (210) ;mRNA; r:537540-538358
MPASQKVPNPLAPGAYAEGAEAVCICGALSSGEEAADEAEQEEDCTICAAASQSAFYRATEAVPRFILLRGGWAFLVIGTYKHDEAKMIVQYFRLPLVASVPRAGSAESRSKRGRGHSATGSGKKKPLWDDAFELRPTPFFEAFEHKFFAKQSLDVALGKPANGKKEPLVADNGDGELLDHMLIKERGESAEDFAKRAFQEEEEEEEES